MRDFTAAGSGVRRRARRASLSVVSEAPRPEKQSEQLPHVCDQWWESRRQALQHATRPAVRRVGAIGSQANVQQLSIFFKQACGFRADRSNEYAEVLVQAGYDTLALFGSVGATSWPSVALGLP